MTEQFITYYTYMGRRLSKSNVVQAWTETDEDGNILSPASQYYVAKKFPYVKRPVIGVIYKVFHSDATKERYFSGKSYHEVYHKPLPNDDRIREWQFEDKTTATIEEMQKQIKDEKPEDMLGEMTLNEIRSNIILDDEQHEAQSHDCNHP